MTGTEIVGGKNRTVTIGKSAKVVDMREREALGRADERSSELRYPVPEQGHVIPVRMDHDDRAGFVHAEEAVRCAVEIGEDRIRADTVFIEHVRCCIRCTDNSPYLWKIILQTGGIPADRYLPATDEGFEGSQIIARQECLQQSCRFFIQCPGKPEIFEDLAVPWFPCFKIHTQPQNFFCAISGHAGNCL